MNKKLTALVTTTLAFGLLCAFAKPVSEKANYYLTLSNIKQSTVIDTADNSTDAYNETFVNMNQTQQYEVNVINEMNSLRLQSGMDPLVVDPALMNTAEVRCAEISSNYSHVRPDSSNCFTAYPECYGWAGENIAYGYQTPEDVMSAWAGSTNHLANMTKPQYKCVGVSVYTAPDGTSYWVQCFGG